VDYPRLPDGALRATIEDMRESQQIAAEHRDLAAHAHRAGAEQHGKETHLTGHESSRQFMEHSNQTHLHQESEHLKNVTQAGEHAPAAKWEDIAARAHQLWHHRGCPEGSPEDDWFRAIEEMSQR